MYTIKIYNKDFSVLLTALFYGDDIYKFKYYSEINKPGGAEFSITLRNAKSTPLNFRVYNKIIIERQETGTQVFIGYIDNLSISLNELEVKCVGMLGFFKKRLYTGVLTDTVTNAVSSVLTATNALDNTGITIGSVTATGGVSGVDFKRSDVLTAWQKLVGVSNSEIEIDPTTRHLNVVPRVGEDKTGRYILTTEQSHILANWRFDEGVGLVATDTSGNGYDGTIYGPSYGIGHANTGLAFNGTSDYIAIDSTSFVLNNTFSVSVWVYPTALTSRHTIISFTNTNTAGLMSMEIDVLGRISVIIPGIYVATTGLGTITPNNWYHIVYTKSGVLAGSQNIYVNTVNTPLIVDVFNTVFTDTADAKNIGRRHAASQLFKGIIDEVRVYDKKLYGAEAISIFNEPPEIPTAPVVIQYKITQLNTANVMDFEVEVDGKDMANSVVGVGNGILSTSQDLVYIGIYGRLDATENFTQTTAPADLANETLTYLDTNKIESYSPKVVINPQKISPEDVNLGDTVRVVMDNGFISLDEYERIIKKEVDVSDNKVEQTVLSLTPESTNLLPSTFTEDIIKIDKRVKLLESTL